MGRRKQRGGRGGRRLEGRRAPALRRAGSGNPGRGAHGASGAWPRGSGGGTPATGRGHGFELHRKGEREEERNRERREKLERERGVVVRESFYELERERDFYKRERRERKGGGDGSKAVGTAWGRRKGK